MTSKQRRIGPWSNLYTYGDVIPYQPYPYPQEYDPYYELHVMHYQLYRQYYPGYPVYQPCSYVGGIPSCVVAAGGYSSAGIISPRPRAFRRR